MVFRAFALLGLLSRLACAAGPNEWAVPACPTVRCAGRSIGDNLGALRFCVPRLVRFKRATGEHGDVHYTITQRRHGRAFELLIVSGPVLPRRDTDLDEWL